MLFIMRAAAENSFARVLNPDEGAYIYICSQIVLENFTAKRYLLETEFALCSEKREKKKKSLFRDNGSYYTWRKPENVPAEMPCEKRWCSLSEEFFLMLMTHLKNYGQ